MIKGILLIVVLIFSFGVNGVNAQKAQEQQFFEVLYDVPVLEGLEALSDEAVAFDKPSGRIAHARAFAANLSEAEILSDYKAALGQMGWRQIKPSRFTREDDVLSISFEKSKGYGLEGLIVVFALTPKEN